jgi:ferredoxin
MKRNLKRLVSLFGSAAEIGRIAGVHRTAVGRWLENDWQVAVPHQIKLLERAQELGLDLGEVAHCLGIDRCDCCQVPVNHEIRALLKPTKKAKAA